MPVATYNRTITQLPIDLVGAATTTLIAAPGTGLKVYVVSFVITSVAGGTIRLEETTSGDDLSGDLGFAANGGLVASSGSDDAPILQANTANRGIQAVHSAGFDGWLRYFVAY